MKLGQRRFPVLIAAAILLSTSVLVARSARRTQQSATVSKETNGGMQIVTFLIPQGSVKVYLPDDITAGDTISGSVVSEAAGSTREELTANKAEIGKLKIWLALGNETQPTEVALKDDKPNFAWTPKIETPSTPNRYLVRIIDVLGNLLGEMSLPLLPPNPVSGSSTKPANPTARHGSGAVITEPETRPQGKKRLSEGANFRLPTMGQQGRTVEIYGPFDGDVSNTTVSFGPVGSTVLDFERNRESESFTVIRPLAESPRKTAFEVPRDALGPAELMLREGNRNSLGRYHNIGVRLSAPKTNLMKGEQTELKIDVIGLEGIKTAVPLQLNAVGVVSLEAGNFQNLQISPKDVNQDGRYVTTKLITGEESGAFTVSATVMVKPFDMCIRSDNNPDTEILLNTFTGNYLFRLPATQPQAHGKSGPAAGTPGSSLTGAGKLTMKGCVISMEHNTADRRVISSLDTCSMTGEASVEIRSLKTIFTIVDKNTADNFCVVR